MAILSREDFYNEQYAPGQDWTKWFPAGFSHYKSLNSPTNYKEFLDGKTTYNGEWDSGARTYGINSKDKSGMLRDFDNAYADYKETAAQNQQKQSLAELQNQENTRNSLAEQIANLTRQGGQRFGGSYNSVEYGNQPPANLSADANFGASDLSTRLNFQVADQDIINDYNNSKLGKLNRIVEDGNSQIAGITSRLEAAQTLYDQLPAKDPRGVSAKVAIDQLKSDLASVQGAVTKASQQVADFKPVAPTDEEGLKQITSFREFAKLPEQRASDQLRQIDPEAYKTAVGLGRQYRQMATQPLGATTTGQTEQLRNTIEQEALNQLRLGSTLGAEERRGYEQSIRAAQTARGNIFGLGPAVQEAAQLGAAGEARKLARYGAAQSFLGSGETTGAATARDLALREGLQQNRLGAASNFIAGGPSLYNLAGQRLAQQNASFQNYINANQAMPNQFQTGPAANQFYQTTNPAIPVQLASNAANIYNTMSDYQANTYGAQVGALSRQETGSQAFGNIASGLGSLFSFSKGF
jgi:hypothetical protein